MARILVRFWIVRFVQVFVVGFAVLAGVELTQRGLREASFGSVLGWAALAALVAASVAAGRAHRRCCKAVFKDPPASESSPARR